MVNYETNLVGWQNQNSWGIILLSENLEIAVQSEFLRPIREKLTPVKLDFNEYRL